MEIRNDNHVCFRRCLCYFSFEIHTENMHDVCAVTHVLISIAPNTFVLIVVYRGWAEIFARTFSIDYYFFLPHFFIFHASSAGYIQFIQIFFSPLSSPAPVSCCQPWTRRWNFSPKIFENSSSISPLFPPGQQQPEFSPAWSRFLFIWCWFPHILPGCSESQSNAAALSSIVCTTLCAPPSVILLSVSPSTPSTGSSFS